MKRPKLYKRLPGRDRSSIRQCSLWQGDDHLLAVERTFSEETYRRYHYNDIQAVIIRPTATWHVGTVIAGLFLLLLVLLSWFFWQENNVEGALFSLFPSAVVLLILLVHLYRGRSCRCYVQMKIGLHELPALRRLRPARKLLERIREPIAVAQKGVQMTAQANTSSPLSSIHKHAPPLLKPYSGRWHLLFYGVLLLEVFFSVWRMFQPGLASFLVNALSAIALMGFAISALVAQRNTRIPGTARVPVWVVLGSYMAITFFSSMYISVYQVMKNPGNYANQTQQLQSMINMQTLDHPVYATGVVIYIAIAVTCLIIGGIATLRYRQLIAGLKA